MKLLELMPMGGYEDWLQYVPEWQRRFLTLVGALASAGSLVKQDTVITRDFRTSDTFLQAELEYIFPAQDIIYARRPSISVSDATPYHKTWYELGEWRFKKKPVEGHLAIVFSDTMNPSLKIRDMRSNSVLPEAVKASLFDLITADDSLAPINLAADTAANYLQLSSNI